MTAPPPCAAPQTITEADNGASFMLSPGSRTSLRLSGQCVWSEPTLRGDAVELARVDYFQDPGFSEWAVLAVRPGTARIAALGNPQCADQEQCRNGPLRFEIEITVG
jgi:predicted secreted protein